MNKQTIILMASIALLLFQNNAIGQTKTEKGVESVLNALSSGTDNFEELSKTLVELKKAAMADFEKRTASN